MGSQQATSDAPFLTDGTSESAAQDSSAGLHPGGGQEPSLGRQRATSSALPEPRKASFKDTVSGCTQWPARWVLPGDTLADPLCPPGEVSPQSSNRSTRPPAAPQSWSGPCSHHPYPSCGWLSRVSTSHPRCLRRCPPPPPPRVTHAHRRPGLGTVTSFLPSPTSHCFSVVTPHKHSERCGIPGGLSQEPRSRALRARCLYPAWRERDSVCRRDLVCR